MQKNKSIARMHNAKDENKQLYRQEKFQRNTKNKSIARMQNAKDENKQLHRQEQLQRNAKKQSIARMQNAKDMNRQEKFRRNAKNKSIARMQNAKDANKQLYRQEKFQRNAKKQSIARMQNAKDMTCFAGGPGGPPDPPPKFNTWLVPSFFCCWFLSTKNNLTTAQAKQVSTKCKKQEHCTHAQEGGGGGCVRIRQGCNYECGKAGTRDHCLTESNGEVSFEFLDSPGV
jgi:5'-3' exonuclease